MVRFLRFKTSDKARIKNVGYDVFAFLIAVVFTGFFVNYVWYFFHAFILGWGDSAPEWYFGIQNLVFWGIFLGSAVFWFFLAYRYFLKDRKKAQLS